VKGRDWFDFLWYGVRKIRPDFNLLENALRQHRPCVGEKFEVTPEWYLEQLDAIIRGTDWSTAKEDVRRFLPGNHRKQGCLRLFDH